MNVMQHMNVMFQKICNGRCNCWGKKESERESGSRHGKQQRDVFLPRASVRFVSLGYVMSSWTVVNFRVFVSAYCMPKVSAQKCLKMCFRGETRDDRYSLACTNTRVRQIRIPIHIESRRIVPSFFSYGAAARNHSNASITILRGHTNYLYN